MMYHVLAMGSFVPEAEVSKGQCELIYEWLVIADE
ncbi:Uncharacterised protein [Serratia proteamaculans]|nr:Uncharacterised protein [Serratia proteamaculans]